PIQLDQPLRQGVLDRQNATVTGVAPEIVLDPQQRKCPGTRTGELRYGLNSVFEKPGGRALQALTLRPCQYGTQRPEGPPMTILGSDLLQPVTAIVHKIPEALLFLVEGVPQEGQIAVAQLLYPQDRLLFGFVHTGTGNL